MINKEKIKQYQRKWYLDNKEKIKQYHKNWCLVNPDKVKASNIRNCKKYYQKNQQTHNEKNKAYLQKFKKERLAYLKKYYQENKEKLKPTRKKYYKKNQDVILSQMKVNTKKWASKNRDKINKSNLKKAEKLAKPLNLNAYEYKNYVQSWSEEVRKRDKNKCKLCGNKADISHHIIFKSKQPELSFNLNNGIALCNSCHYELHRLNS